MEFYDSTESLVDSVAAFLHPSLSDGAAVFIGTPGNREGLAGALGARGVDVDAVQRSGHLVVLDASDTLPQLQVDDIPHPAAFEHVIGGVLDEAARSGGPVRVFGEMVAVLWEQGLVDAAMRLEELWNDAAETRSFQLLCGYPATLFAQPGSAADLGAVCEQHTSVTMTSMQGSATLPFGELAGRTAERIVCWQFPADPTSGARARRLLRDLLASWKLVELLDEAELLMSELVNNAVVHADSHMGVRVLHREGALRIEVSDVGSGAPRRGEGGPADTAGRGLLLVEAFSQVWGTAADSDGKSVWFELAI